MKLYDTVQQRYIKTQFGSVVRMYVCGVTPYDTAHIGHIFTFLTYDLLQRRLEDVGHSVQMVRNITDVDDPLYVKAAELGIDYRDLAARETLAFQKTMKQLNFRPALAEPKASEYITPMAEAVADLLNKGFAYKVGADVYFDSALYPGFASFSGFKDRVRAGLFAQRGGDPERLSKRNPQDFLLWKSVADPADPAQWITVLGSGRPGWHIECSVMSSTILGVPFDIHGGGSDLIFPHHTAEAAQTYGLHNTKLANLWVHVYSLSYGGEKMSKSLGNLVFAMDLLKDYDPSVIRLALMHYHHRIGGEWQTELLLSAQKLHTALKQAHFSLHSAENLLHDVRVALDDDINTHEVLDALDRFIKSSSRFAGKTSKSAREVLEKSCKLLGITL